MPCKPLPPLPEKYAAWTRALSEACDVLTLGGDDSEEALRMREKGESWRSTIRSWPVLDTIDLQGELPLLQQAHRVLAFLLHYYVHSSPPPGDASSKHVPASLAVPLVAVSRTLGIAPILTFADTVLWNWELIDSTKPVSVDNMRILEVFSGTEDERMFHAVSATVELRGVEALEIIDSFNHLSSLSSRASVARINKDLARLTGIIEDISEIIQSVQPLCDPHVFYWGVRPWFCGSDATGPDTPGWIYDGVPNSHLLDLSGPSGGQSTTIHALDAFFDIDHKPRPRRPDELSLGCGDGDGGFMQRMRRYMPGPHRQFLEHLDGTPITVRELALTTPALRDAYDDTIMALKRLRDRHMRVVCRYIVNMSRSRPDVPAGCPVSAMIDKLARGESENALRGTGGNELSILLKATRDATKRAMVRNQNSS
ncbi:Indoleamine 2,3-dioxygenase [Hymenopellis radicata]|nr:Indoleamine 2,3-dioxygenase [Hymenopellis radicata]